MPRDQEIPCIDEWWWTRWIDGRKVSLSDRLSDLFQTCFGPNSNALSCGVRFGQRNGWDSNGDSSPAEVNYPLLRSYILSASVEENNQEPSMAASESMRQACVEAFLAVHMHISRIVSNNGHGLKFSSMATSSRRDASHSAPCLLVSRQRGPLHAFPCRNGCVFLRFGCLLSGPLHVFPDRNGCVWLLVLQTKG